MACKRSDVFDPDEVGIYHCYARCVRRAFLCGRDALTGQDYSHRRQWVFDRVRELAEIFLIDAAVFGIMNNHYHLELRNRPDLAEALSDEEVVRRWRTLYPHRRDEDGRPVPLTPWELTIETRDKENVAEWRRRLSHISWFMKSLNEFIARKANCEDGVTGHFWQERFKCTRLLDEWAVLACSIYIDLNEIRARMASTPEASPYISAATRIRGRQARQADQQALAPEGNADAEAACESLESARPTDPDYWLCPVNESVQLPPLSPWPGPTEFAPGVSRRRRLTRQGYLAMSQDQYLQLLDWTGRQYHADKPGAIPADLAPILERLGADAESWTRAVRHFGRGFRRVVGKAEKMIQLAKRKNRCWFQGLELCRQIFG